MTFANAFPSRDEMAQLTAKMLLEIGAVALNADDPWTLASGLKSPTYIDCRKLISYPRIRSALMDFAVASLYRDVGFEAFDAVAGGETAGIPFAAFIAERTGLPMLYVRKKPKGYGKNAQIEGDLKDGARVLLVEDLATDGGSKVRFVEGLRNAGAVCDHTFVIFFYDIFSGSREALSEHGLALHALATWRDVLDAARTAESFDTKTLDSVGDFLDDPIAWSDARGGNYVKPG